MQIVRAVLPLLLLLGCAARIEQEEIDEVLALEGDADLGEQVYADSCERCHDADGNGEKWAVRLEEHVPEHTDAELVESILAGPFIMPNFVKKLEPQEVADVVAYLRDRWG